MEDFKGTSVSFWSYIVDNKIWGQVRLFAPRDQTEYWIEGLRRSFDGHICLIRSDKNEFFTVIFTKDNCKLSLKPYKGGKIPKIAHLRLPELPGSWGVRTQR